MKSFVRSFAAGLALCPAAPAIAQDAQAFATCRACHSVAKGAPNGVGPNLYNVVGRPAASAPGFNYSLALKASRLVWTEATLNDFLAAPMKKVPGTRMPIATPDPVKRAALIAYLKAQGGK